MCLCPSLLIILSIAPKLLTKQWSNATLLRGNGGQPFIEGYGRHTPGSIRGRRAMNRQKFKQYCVKYIICMHVRRIMMIALNLNDKNISTTSKTNKNNKSNGQTKNTKMTSKTNQSYKTGRKNIKTVKSWHKMLQITNCD